MLPLRMLHHCARSLITRLHRSAIKRAYKAGRDTGDENDPLAQAEAALQVLPAPPSPPPPPPLTLPHQTIGAGDMPYETGSYDYRGKARSNKAKAGKKK